MIMIMGTMNELWQDFDPGHSSKSSCNAGDPRTSHNTKHCTINKCFMTFERWGNSTHILPHGTRSGKSLYFLF